MKIFKYRFEVVMYNWDDEEESVFYNIYDTTDPDARKQLKFMMKNDRLDLRSQKILSRRIIYKTLLTDANK